jgi:hypothetical protein
MTPELARELCDHYGDLETAAALAEASPEWEHTYLLPREMPRMERVAWFFRFLDKRHQGEASGHEPASPATPGPEPTPLPRAAANKASDLLGAGTSKREIARQTGISRQHVDKIDAWRSGRGYVQEPGPTETTVVFRKRAQNRRRAADPRRWPPKVVLTDPVIY